MSQKSAEKIAEDAKGDIDPSELTETESSGLLLSSTLLYDKPIIHYLQEDEDLLYLYSSTESESFQVDIQSKSDRGEYAPYKDVDGKRYFVITNKRILCVAGCSDGDKTTEVQYADVAESGTHEKLKEKTGIYVKKEDNTEYKFVFSTSNHDLPSACEYISAQGSRKSTNKTNSDGKDQSDTNKTNSEDQDESDTENTNSDNKNSADQCPNCQDGRINWGLGVSKCDSCGQEFKFRDDEWVEISRESQRNNEITTSDNIYSHICIFPDAPAEMSSIANQETLTQTETITDKKLLRDDQHTKIYKYKNIHSVELSDKCIKIGGNKASVGYENIVHVEFVSKEDTSSIPNNYIRLVIDKLEETFTYLYFVVGDHGVSTTGNNWSARIKRRPDTDRFGHKKMTRGIKQKCTNLRSDIIILNDWIEKSGELRIEGLEKGNSRTGGTISGSTKSEGSSTGVQVGPFSKSKTKSEGSIEGKITSVTSDNTFSSDIDFVQIDKDGIYVESDPVIDVSYQEIDRVAKRDNGIFLEIGQHSYSISGHGYMSSAFSEQPSASFEKYDLRSIVSSIEDRMSESSSKIQTVEQGGDTSSSQTPAEKMKDLKELYDNGIISEEEFNSKKSDLLDEF